MENKMFIKKAIAYFLTIFIVVSLCNFSNASTIFEYAKKYQTQSQKITDKNLSSNKQEVHIVHNLAYVFDFNYQKHIDEKFHNGDANLNNNTSTVTQDENTELATEEQIVESPELTEDAKFTAECNYNYFKLSAGYLRGLFMDMYGLYAVRGDIKLDNVTYTIENESEEPLTPEFNLDYNGLLTVKWGSLRDGVLVITIYYYHEGNKQWYKDTCRISTYVGEAGENCRGGSTKNKSNWDYYVLSGKETFLGRKDEMVVYKGKTKYAWIARHTDSAAMDLIKFAPEISEIDMVYDSEYIDVTFEDNHFKITGKKIGSTKLKITFFAVDKNSYIFNGVPAYKGYFSVYAEVNVREYPEIDVEDNNSNDDDNNDNKNKIPESISLKEANPTVKVGEYFKFEILCDGEKDYTEEYAILHSYSDNRELGDFRDGNDLWFKAKKPGKVKIKFEKDFKEGSNLIKTLTCEGTVTIVDDDESDVEITNIELNKEVINLQIGFTFQLEATIEPDNAKNNELRWESSNSSIATVDNYGNITAKNEGTCIITVKASNGKSATCKVVVYSP